MRKSLTILWRPDHRMSSNPRSNIPMRTNMIAPVRNSHRRTSDDYISPPSGVTPSPTTVENNQKTVVLTSNESQQQQQVSVPKQEPTRQQTQRKRLKFAQRKVITRPDNNISTASNWRASSGWTVSRTFPVRIDQSGSEQREQREQWKNEQQYQQQQNRRKQEQEHKKALEQLRIRQELQRMQQKQQHIKQEEQQRIWRQEEEQRRVQEQQRVQEMQRRQKERQHQEQQRFQQQQFERKIDEQRKLEEQKRVNELYTGLNGEEREHRLDRNGENNLRQLKTPLQQNIQDSAMTTRMTTFFNPAARTSSLYDVGDEEGDYDYSHAASETTVTPNEGTQIRGTKRPKDLPFLFENQVPCAAFTDEICMEQKKRIGADRMSKCCDKGIYLTDLCVPGRCTNATIELCCMQKFLQSKYKCCFNDSEAINSPGDAFSRCCFHRFVQNDDKCCPARRAKFHWLTAHEICLPNVRIDLSNLRFSVHVPKNVNNNNSNQEVNNTITIDLNVDKSWDHSCEQGTKVLQFPYLPDDEFSDWKEIYENSEESR